MKITLIAGLLALSILFIPQKSERFLERSPSAENCLEIVSELISPKIYKLPVGVNSIFDRYPQITQKMEDLIFHDIHFDEFYSEFVKANKKAPTLRDGILHIYNVRRNVLKSYDEIIDDLRAINDPRIELFRTEIMGSREKLTTFKDLEQLNAEIKASNIHGKTKLTSLDETIRLQDEVNFEERYFHYLKERTGQSNFHGEYGELYAMGATADHVVKRGLVFKTNAKNAPNAYEENVIVSVHKFRSILEAKTELEIKKIIQNHGKGLLRRAQEYLETTPEDKVVKSEMIDHIINMIKTKEIDLVTKNANNKYTWSEVKAYKKPITPELLKDSHGKKSILEQLIEHKAMRDLLGLKNTVELSFISPNTPISPEAKKLLASVGFKSQGAE